MYYLLTFENTHTAISTKKEISKLLAIRTMPTLREISASCGISLRIEEDGFEVLKDFLNGANLDEKMYALYLIDEDRGGIKFEKVLLDKTL